MIPKVTYSIDTVSLLLFIYVVVDSMTLYGCQYIRLKGLE